MTLLQIILIIITVIFIIILIDMAQRKKINWLHIVVFLLWFGAILLFILMPELLNRFWQLFWLARWADLLVYLSIIFLFLFFLWIYNKSIKQSIQQTNLARHISIQQSQWSINPKIKTCLVMPTYRQDDKVLKLIDQIVNQWYWLIFVDDWFNKDLPTKIQKQFQDKNVVIINHIYNLWQWAALQTWHKYIQDSLPNIKYVVHFDSDGQHQTKDIKSFEQAFQKDKSLDIVFWSRFLDWAMEIPKRRAFHKRMQLLFIKIFIWLKLTDTNNWFRMIKASKLKDLEITMDRFEHASEIEMLTKQNKLKYSEVPVDIIYSEEIVANGQSLTNAFNIARKMIYRIFFFK